jgi:hypothetical protein
VGLSQLFDQLFNSRNLLTIAQNLAAPPQYKPAPPVPLHNPVDRPLTGQIQCDVFEKLGLEVFNRSGTGLVGRRALASKFCQAAEHQISLN